MSEKTMVVVYGVHAVQALLTQRPQDVISLHSQQDNKNLRIESLIEKARALGIKLNFTTEDSLQQLTSKAFSHIKVVHQGIVAIAKPNKPLSEKQLQQDCQRVGNNPESQLWLVLDNIQDPQNLGAILRNAESCACNGIISPSHHSAPLNQTARKIASGAAELVKFYQVSNLARAITHLQQAAIWTIGLDAEQQDEQIKNTASSQNLFNIDLTGNIAFILGSEGSGLRQKTKHYCDQIAHLPMLGNTQSLNVSHATTVALFETIRQRQHK